MTCSIAGFAAVPLFAGDKKLEYPKTAMGDTVDVVHGVKVPDPYQWLEDLDSPRTAEWVAAQNKVTFGFLESIPQREAIKNRITRLYDFEKYGLPYKEGDLYFFSKNDGLQNQSVIYVTETLEAEPRVLIDPNSLSKDGTVALSTYAPTRDGKLFAYGVSSGGSDWVEFRVRDIQTGTDLPDVLKWAKFTGASWVNSEGFFYSRYDEPTGDKLEQANFNQKMFYHRIGTNQSEDVLVMKDDQNPRRGFGGSVTDDGKFLVISIWEGTERKNRVYVRPLSDSGMPGNVQGKGTGEASLTIGAAKITVGDAETIIAGSLQIGDTIKMLDQFDAQYGFIDNIDNTFYFFTDNGAPRGRVVAIDLNNPDPANWKEIIPQADETLQGASLVNNTFIATYLKDAYTQVKQFDLNGKLLRNIDLPGIGSAGGFGGKRDETETFYSFTSFNYPPTIFRLDLKNGKSTIYKQPDVDFDPTAYEVKQVFYPSKDGTKVPMFITHKKGIKLDGSNPTLLYGYGGFNIPVTPSFSTSNLVWMEMGGVYASACIRGGGEYGKDWHNAGRLKNKQNVFDDFIAAAEWLAANKYTQPKKLAISGGSNGGLLVGACITQRPDLFGAALPAVGVLDMYRFHKFTIGHAWTSDYGNPDNPEDFAVLAKYCPLHNLKVGTKYPATLITTGDHDDRVVPSHSFKFAAALQQAQAGDAPTLIRIDVRAGHGAGKPTAKIIEEAADRWTFLVKVLDMNVSLEQQSAKQE
jgi:prolyl oligopeptidase